MSAYLLLGGLFMRIRTRASEQVARVREGQPFPRSQALRPQAGFRAARVPQRVRSGANDL